MNQARYAVIEKAVGETPLACLEAWRATQPALADVPLAYAGRLDPMASGKLLILIGEECKVQEKYHGLDKEYEFSVLFGLGSDTGDVLGRLDPAAALPTVNAAMVKTATKELTGELSLPYPLFSSKTVQGKPLHTWTLQGRLDEIEIPTNHSTVHTLTAIKIGSLTRSEIHKAATAKIETIPAVTEVRKELGQDFRRALVREDWADWLQQGEPGDSFPIVTFKCICSAGTYMRSLAEAFGRITKTKALAYHIHRTEIGRFRPLPILGGWWRQRY